MPVEGIRPAFARLFANAAEFDPSDIGTRELIRIGRLDDIIHIDPGAPEALTHKPARLINQLPWFVLKRDYADRETDPTSAGKAIAAVLSLFILLTPGAAGWVAIDALWNAGPIGLVIGAVVTLTAMYTAEDGHIEFDTAPVHYQKAEQNLTGFRRAYKEAKEDQNAIDRARRAEAETVQEAREDQDAENETFIDVIAEPRATGGGGDDEATEGDG
ncbi:MAG: hypothetical protein U5J98_06940 [Halobacteriales archaeon]|nr:hypothetical protein [Halobacteriales archaeon]